MFFVFSFLVAIFFAYHASANPACVVCTVAIGTSLSIAHKLGVSDCVVGVWSGAMLAILGYWTIRLFEKRNWNFPYRNFILMLLSIAMIGFIYVSTLEYKPLIIGFLYIDSFLWANIVGALTLIFSMHFYAWLKEKNSGHAHFPFEKVVLPLAFVFFMSVLFHYLEICHCVSNEN